MTVVGEGRQDARVAVGVRGAAGDRGARANVMAGGEVGSMHRWWDAKHWCSRQSWMGVTYCWISWLGVCAMTLE